MCKFAQKSQENNMFERIKEIVEGWKNYAFTDPKIEELAEYRAGICGECPEPQPGLFQVLDNSTMKFKQVEGLVCNQCGCPLSAKTRSPNSACPLNKWLEMRINLIKVQVESVRMMLCKSLQELLIYSVNNNMSENLVNCFAIAIDSVARSEDGIYKATGHERRTPEYTDRIYRAKIYDARKRDLQIANVIKQVQDQYNKLEAINKANRFIDEKNSLVSLEPGSFKEPIEILGKLISMLPEMTSTEHYE